MNKVILIFFLSQFVFAQAFSQADSAMTDTSKSDKINIFLDCEFCDHNFIKQDIPFVNYVRDQNEANLYIIITSQNTGSGGKEYTILFAGLNNFEFMNDIFRYVSKPNDTENEIRSGISQVIKLGLMRYIVKTPLSRQITLTYSKPEEKTNSQVKDKWHNWVFGIDLYGSFMGEQSYNSKSVSGSVYANKVTENYKFLFSSAYNYRDNNYTIEDTVISSFTTSKNLTNIFVKSLGKHWSAGYLLNLYSSTYSNYKLRYYIFPSIEYNLFPYSESTSKQLRFQYSAGYMHSQYIDSTIYNKIREGLYANSLDISLKVIKNWGSISTVVSAFSYLHDLSKNNLSLYTTLSIRIVKGLSVSLSGNVSMINDQISLPKGEASSEEILLQQRQLATQYSYYGSVGISYTFGSIYNNIVNPRFGE